MKKTVLAVFILFVSLSSQAGLFDSPTLKGLVTESQNLASDKPFSDYLTTLNKNVNKLISYTSDGPLPEDDSWQSPLQTLEKKQGDCEDYAVLKYFLLKQSLSSTVDIRIGFARTKPENVSHAILLVRPDAESEYLVLDNLVDKALPLNDRKDLWLFMSVNEQHQYRADNGQILNNLINIREKLKKALAEQSF